MKTTVRVLVTVALLATLAACGGGDSDSSDTRGSGGSEQPAGEDPSGAEDPDGPVEVGDIEPAAARASDFIGGNVDPELPDGEPGEIALIGHTEADGEEFSFGFVVRNNTGDTLHAIDVEAEFVHDGDTVDTAGAQNILPTVVEPGQIAFGVLDVVDPPPAGTEIQITASGENDYDEAVMSTPLIMGDAELDIADGGGILGDELVGTATVADGYAEPTGAPFVAMLCADPDGTLGAYSATSVDTAAVDPGDTFDYAMAVIDAEDCPDFLVAGSA